MPNGQDAVTSGADLEGAVATVACTVGLQVRTQVCVARWLWGAERRSDLVLNHGRSGHSLGIECKFQGTGGSAEEKIPATIQDIAAWPIPGIVVFEGAGFSTNMRTYLHSTGMAVAYEDLHGWLVLFFGLADAAGRWPCRAVGKARDPSVTWPLRSVAGDPSGRGPLGYSSSTSVEADPLGETHCFELDARELTAPAKDIMKLRDQPRPGRTDRDALAGRVGRVTC